MDDDLTRDIGSPLASDDVAPSEEDTDDLDDNFDRELREAERELEKTELPPKKGKIEIHEADDEE
jgi:hypothetical protein